MAAFLIKYPLKWFLPAALIWLSLSTNCYRLMSAREYKETQPLNRHVYYTPTSQLNSLFPAADPETCKTQPKGPRLGASLEVRNRHDPCSSPDKSKRPSYAKTLEVDEARAKSIRDRVKTKLVGVGEQNGVDLPAKSGLTIGTGNFVVTVGLGTPKRDLSLAFDTGSDLTWTQCEPCVGSCYKQEEEVFDPKESSTYSNISCTSPLCSQVRSATSITPSCSSSSTCIYGIQYADKSFSAGFLAKDTLHLGPQDAVPGFLFGCGQDNEGIFGETAGILGLGRDYFSAVSQTASNLFSYCLPFATSSTGHLTFGQGGTSSKAIQYTPLSKGSSSKDQSLYFIQLQGMSVGGQKLAIPPSVFSTSGTIIDSGTVITRFPPDAYSALRDNFDKYMSNYPKVTSSTSKKLDTCYDFSGQTNITVPKISLFFEGGMEIELPISGILLGTTPTQACLAFISNDNADDVGILGNLQQLTFDVVYDVAAGRLGFGVGGCS